MRTDLTAAVRSSGTDQSTGQTKHQVLANLRVKQNILGQPLYWPFYGSNKTSLVSLFTGHSMGQTEHPCSASLRPIYGSNKTSLVSLFTGHSMGQTEHPCSASLLGILRVKQNILGQPLYWPFYGSNRTSVLSLFTGQSSGQTKHPWSASLLAILRVKQNILGQPL